MSNKSVYWDDNKMLFYYFEDDNGYQYKHYFDVSQDSSFLSALSPSSFGNSKTSVESYSDCPQQEEKEKKEKMFPYYFLLKEIYNEEDLDDFQFEPDVKIDILFSFQFSFVMGQCMSDEILKNIDDYFVASLMQIIFQNFIKNKDILCEAEEHFQKHLIRECLIKALTKAFKMGIDI